MNLLAKPELLERLAAAHALGSLRGGARRRFESIARHEPAVRAAALAWRGRLGALVELQSAQTPPPEVWKRIEAQVRRDLAQRTAPDARATAQQPADMPSPARPPGQHRHHAPWWSAWTPWLGAGMGAALAAAALLVVGIDQRAGLENQLAQLRGQLQAQARRADAAQQQLERIQRVEYVAVLSDDKSAASMLVTFDPGTRRLTLKRVGAFREAGDKSLQLWVIAPGAGPRSLGVLGSDAVVQLTAQERDVGGTPTLAISLEPKGGVSGDSGPSGPVLFKGALLRTGS